jgi:hypothetical protein
MALPMAPPKVWIAKKLLPESSHYRPLFALFFLSPLQPCVIGFPVGCIVRFVQFGRFLSSLGSRCHGGFVSDFGEFLERGSNFLLLVKIVTAAAAHFLASDVTADGCWFLY